MHIGDLLKKRYAAQKSRRGTYWTDMVKECMEIINRERAGTKYKAMSFVAVRNKVAHLNDGELTYLLSICKDAKNRKVMNQAGILVQGSFSKVFFGALKVRHDDPRTGGKTATDS